MDKKIYVLLIAAVLLCMTLFGWQQGKIKTLEARILSLESSLSKVQSEVGDLDSRVSDVEH